MIARVWVLLFSMILLVTAPLLVTQYYSQKEGVELIFEVTSKASSPELLQNHLALLKEIARLDPGNLGVYRAQFDRAADSLIVQQELDLIKTQIIGSLLRQTMRNALIVGVCAFLLSLILARKIVQYFQRLLNENRSQSQRLEKTNSLESWQRLARVLVHELRAPMTPIRLIASDIESKYLQLPSEKFGRYLHEGAGLIQEQVSVIESMTENFIRFAKLPEPVFVEQSVSAFIGKFVATYSDYRPGTLVLRAESSDESLTARFDEKLLTQLFFNLLKNACEANPQALVVTMSARGDDSSVKIQMANNGRAIPEDFAKRIFEMHVTSKTEGANLGLGLTICKKIAFDHKGDLNLVRNSSDGVAFELEVVR